MNTMTEQTKKLMTDTLKRLIQETGDCDQAALHKKACDIFTDTFNGRPALARKAAEIYNSSKTLHKLATAEENQRAENFPLLDPLKVFDDLSAPAEQADLRKAASGISFTPSLIKKTQVAPIQK